MKIKASTLRTLSVLFFVAITAIGLAFKTGGGTLSTFGYRTISVICPLGAIEAMLASRSFLPRALVSLAVLLLLVILLGRVFCAWICPAPLVHRWLLGRSRENGDTKAVTSPSEPRQTRSGIALDSRHFVLGGALLSTAIFGFPVFCLVCPIGLIFATLIGLWRLIQFNEPTWTLLIFPAVLVLELAICRRWCGKLCPLGALLSLVSSLNVFVRPRVDKDACLRTAHGVDCKLCKGACLEGIDLHQREDSAPLAECTKCRECSDSCPVNAIRFPFFAKKEKGVKCPD